VAENPYLVGCPEMERTGCYCSRLPELRGRADQAKTLQHKLSFTLGQPGAHERGCQWKELPIDKGPDGLPEIRYTRVYRVRRRWVTAGCFDAIFADSVFTLNQHGLLDPSVDGTTTAANEGGDNIGFSGHKRVMGDEVVAMCDRNGNAAIADIEQRTSVSRRQLYRLLQRCVSVHEHGTVFGWRALVPHPRVDRYQRTARLALSRAGHCSGATGPAAAPHAVRPRRRQLPHPHDDGRSSTRSCTQRSSPSPRRRRLADGHAPLIIGSHRHDDRPSRPAADIPLPRLTDDAAVQIHDFIAHSRFAPLGLSRQSPRSLCRCQRGKLPVGTEVFLGVRRADVLPDHRRAVLLLVKPLLHRSTEESLGCQ
jgi:hypothetical protein